MLPLPQGQPCLGRGFWGFSPKYSRHTRTLERAWVTALSYWANCLNTWAIRSTLPAGSWVMGEKSPLNFAKGFSRLGEDNNPIIATSRSAPCQPQSTVPKASLPRLPAAPQPPTSNRALACEKLSPHPNRSSIRSNSCASATSAVCCGSASPRFGAFDARATSRKRPSSPSASSPGESLTLRAGCARAPAAAAPPQRRLLGPSARTSQESRSRSPSCVRSG